MCFTVKTFRIMGHLKNYFGDTHITDTHGLLNHKLYKIIMAAKKLLCKLPFLEARLCQLPTCKDTIMLWKEKWTISQLMAHSFYLHLK